jgi:hypothetical protein
VFLDQCFMSHFYIFFFAAYVALLCECGVITARLVRDLSSKRNCYYETMLEFNICFCRPYQYVDVLKCFHSFKNK